MGIATSIYGSALSTAALIKTYLGTDDKADASPSRSAIYDIRSEDWNVIVAGLAEVALRTRLGNLCAYGFSMPNAVAGLTSSDLYRAGGGDTAVLYAVAPWAGSVVGLGVRVEGARSAGTLTAKWHVASTDKTLSVAINATTPQTNYATQLPGVEAFAAGNLLGVSITTDGSWAAGATPSVNVDLIVAYGE